jgi:methyltransferase (TIGR00027 family)
MWVAACRGLGTYLPPEEQLVRDPFGLDFGGPAARALGDALDRLPPSISAAVVRTWAASAGVYWMQIRSRVIDLAVEDFVARGGAQVVILGAGFDCRAFRLDALSGARVFEVDHPATQRVKRARMEHVAPRAERVDFVSWDFEARSVAELPSALAALGHDPDQPTITIWEGVTMYLSELAIDATVRAVGALGTGAPSTIVFNYFERDAIARKNRGLRLAVAALGEPFRFGWHPAALPSWFAARGFDVRSDREDVALAAELLPRVRRPFRTTARHIVVAESAPRR